MSDIAVVIPFLNEKENLLLLHHRLTEFVARLGDSYEIIYVDDGSLDGSLAVLRDLYEADQSHVRIIEFCRNYGRDITKSC